MSSKFPLNWREILAKNIYHERVRLNLSQIKLVEKLKENGIEISNPGTISVWENGKGTFNLNVTDALCRIFNRTPYELMYVDLVISPPPDDNDDKPKEALVKEMNANGASKASESPPQKGEKEEIQEMRKQMLEMMMKLEEMTQ